MTELTKREQFALAAMQGSLANGCRMGTLSVMVEFAVTFADALISELDKKERDSE